jgi:uncharacterized protein (TIGR03435 family)
MVLVATVIGLTAGLIAQTPKPTFEVASIRRNLSGAGGEIIDATGRGGVFRATRATVYRLLLSAYGVRDDQLIDVPNWVRTDRFDITARAADADVPRERILLMIQSLLEHRFALVARQEHRERDIYVLRVARSDGRLGTDLRRADENCEKDRPTDAFAVVARMPRPSSGARPSFAAACVTMTGLGGLVRALERNLETTVIDDTGLTGRWDIAVAYGGLAPTATPGSSGSPDERPSLFVALEEQLGLELERTRGSVAVLVLDSVERPTEN